MGIQDACQDDSYDPWKGKKKPEEHKMFTPPQSARGSMSPRQCAPPGLGEPLPRDLTLDSIPHQTASGGLSDEEKKDTFYVLLREASGHGV